MKKGSTWGDAAKKRIKNQNAAVKNAYKKNTEVPKPRIKVDEKVVDDI